MAEAGIGRGSQEQAWLLYGAQPLHHVLKSRIVRLLGAYTQSPPLSDSGVERHTVSCTMPSVRATAWELKSMEDGPRSAGSGQCRRYYHWDRKRARRRSDRPSIDVSAHRSLCCCIADRCRRQWSPPYERAVPGSRGWNRIWVLCVRKWNANREWTHRCNSRTAGTARSSGRTRCVCTAQAVMGSLQWPSAQKNAACN